jgi:UDP-N-acetylglucosamine 2-epimerase (non-hydrolysing)
VYKVCTIFGTRPEAIKMAPVIKELQRHPSIKTRIIVTAQHREILDQVLQVFQLSSDDDLDLMVSDQTLQDLTAKVILGATNALQAARPDIVLVQGDTTTTFGVALAAFYLKIPVWHVEAGLRTYDRFHPFPEEINRCLTTVLADVHFAPTQTAKNNLLNEGVGRDKIRVTGNTVIDALLSVVRPDYDFSNTSLAGLDTAKKWLLVTAHRRENFGQPIEDICIALSRLAEIEDLEIIYPVHPNPHIRNIVHARLGNTEHVHLVAPLPYDLFVQVMNRSVICLTDSGGIQEEAPSLGKPVLVMREVTERPEAVAAGTALVIGTDSERIIKETTRLLRDDRAYSAMANRANPYGDGKAAKRIVSTIMHEFGLLDYEESQFE